MAPGKTNKRNPDSGDERGESAGARWRRRKEARPQEILEAALGVFAEKGFAAARLEEIAARAGVSKGTIYLYFESKEAVFRALIQDRLASRVGGMADMLPGYTGSSAELLADLIRTFGAVMSTSDLVVLPKMVVAEAGNFPELARVYREEVINRGLALIGDIIERGIKRGEFRNISRTHAARLVVGPLMIIAIWRTTFSKFDDEPYDYLGLVDAHIETLLRGLAKETE